MGTLENIENVGNKNQNYTWQPQKTTRRRTKLSPVSLYLVQNHRVKKFITRFDYNVIEQKFGEFGELKNYLPKDIVLTGVIDNSFKERMLREISFTLEKEIALRQSTEQPRIHAREQEAEVYRIKSNKNKKYCGRTVVLWQKCKCCGRTHMIGAWLAFHQTLQ